MSASIDRRLEHLKRTDHTLGFVTEDEATETRKRVMAACEGDPVLWINDWAWAHDPRVEPPLPRTQPFDLWPKQVGWIRLLERLERDQSEGVCEKSRDVGMSWMNAAYAVHRWLFIPNSKITMIADKQDTVDKLGDIDSLMEKCRFLITHLPKWMLPRGFDERVDLRFKAIRNRHGRSTIVGRTGDNAGRGGRSSMIFIDEAAHIPRANKLDAAVSANSNVRIWVSSVNGNGNVFARKAQGGKLPVYRLHYSDDPRKDAEWVQRERRSTDAVLWAQEREIDYGASITDLIIPGSAAIASRELHRRLIDPGATFARAEAAAKVRARLERFLERRQASIAGLDVGAGKAESVLVSRCGPVCEPPMAWLRPDTTETAETAAAEALRRRCSHLYFDEVGVGQGVLATMSRLHTTSLHIQGVNTGMPPSERQWPDGRPSSAIFLNQKIELWWLAREALRAAEELLWWLDAKPGGHGHQVDDVLLLPDDDELGRQLVTPTFLRNARGKLQSESKDDLARRGVASPDRADALVLTFAEPAVPVFYVG